MTTTHVIVLPGGGYQHLADHEGEPVAEWLRSLGLGASVLRYPVETRHPGPLDAVRAEIRRVRAAGADQVGLIGFSAGGHLAGHAALAPGATDDERVDLTILGYPVVSMQLPTHAGSRETLIGRDASDELREATSVDRLVAPAAERGAVPPFFIWHTVEDASVPVRHSYLLGLALGDLHLPHALHVYARGAHGLGFAIGAGDAEHWRAACESWLRDSGFIA